MGERAGQLQLGSGTPRDAVVGAMQGQLAHARQVVRAADRQPVRAVHEWRKTMRRARALVRLCRPLLEKRQAQRLGTTLREAQAAASQLRDAHVLGPLLTELAADRHASVADRVAMASVRRRLRSREQAARRGAPASDLLEQQLPALENAVRRFGRLLPPALTFGDLQAGLSKSYRRALKSFRRSRKQGEQAFHDLRKAVKVLHYQTELLASAGPQARAAEKLRKRLGRLAHQQGEVTDLLLLRSALVPPEREALAVFLSRALRRQCRPAMRTAGKLLDHSPRELEDRARRLLQQLPAAPGATARRRR